MRYLVAVLLMLTCLHVRASETSAAAVARFVTETDVAKALSAALHGSDPLTRATAARVALIRGEKSLTAEIRQVLVNETSDEAAREEIRTIIVLGDDADVAFAVSSAATRPPRVDAAVADAVARLGGSRAIELYFSTVRQLRAQAESNFFTIALWGHPELVEDTASRLVAARDEVGWMGLLRALGTAQLKSSTMVSALRSSSLRIQRATVDRILDQYSGQSVQLPEDLREAVNNLASPADLTLSESFKRELLRRMFGNRPQEIEGSIKWLDSDDGRQEVSERLATLLTDQERRAWTHGSRKTIRIPDVGRTETDLKPPHLMVSGLLPVGLTKAILSAGKCSEAAIGVARMTIDPAGRVQELDVSRIQSSMACVEALANVLRLAFVDPQSIGSAPGGSVIVVKPPRDAPCLDATPVDLAPAGPPIYAGGPVKGPVVVRRVEPIFPGTVRQSMTESDAFVIIEAVITEMGCVRQMHLVKQTAYAPLNASSLLALSQWKFKAGTLDGQPVPVIFNLTIHFRAR